MKTWYAKIQEAYSSLEELISYNEIYKIAERCGYRSCKKLWKDNPIIGGSSNPKDFGIVEFNPEIYLECAEKLANMYEWNYCCFIIEDWCISNKINYEDCKQMFQNLFGLNEIDSTFYYLMIKYGYLNINYDSYVWNNSQEAKELRIFALLMAYQFYK